MTENIVNLENMSNEELVAIYQKEKSEDALEALCLKNKRFIYKCISMYNANTYTGYSVSETDDILQVGYMAIIEAAKRFDTTMGTSFLTYAGNWLQREITTLKSETFYAVKLPPTVMAQTARIANEIESLERDTDLTSAEIIKIVAKNNKMSVDKVNKMASYRNMWMKKVSVDTPIHPADASCRDTIVDMYVGDDNQNNQEDTTKMLVDQILEKVVFDPNKTKNDRIMNMVMDRYGICGRKPHTLEELGVKYNLTRERCRQIVEKGIQKMAATAKRLDITPETIFGA